MRSDPRQVSGCGRRRLPSVLIPGLMCSATPSSRSRVSRGSTTRLSNRCAWISRTCRGPPGRWMPRWQAWLGDHDMTEPELAGQTVVLIGGSSGIGLETARRARAEGAEVIITGRNPGQLEEAAQAVDAHGTAAFDVSDTRALQRFFSDLPAPIDHVLVTAGRPRYGPLLEMTSADVREALSDHVVMA